MTALAREPLHVAQIGFYNDPQGRAPEELLESWPTLVDVAEAAARSGVCVSVVQACARHGELERNGVRYYFLPFGQRSATPRLAELGERLRTLAPQPPHLLHVHGLDFPRQVLSLATLVPDTPIVLQDHASHPPPIWRRSGWRRALSAAAGVAFCAVEQAQPFVAAGIISRQAPVYGIPESSSRFTPGDRASARRATGLNGDPAVLWVGHLDTNKDPLAVLAGVSLASRQLPGLRLYCCFGVAPLLRQVEERIASDPQLRDRVRLLGRVPHEQIEQLMRAADLFVLGSHREGSGYSLIEALACGLPPVVTQIPSFRALTGAGAVGRLWPCGDVGALGAALSAVAAQAGESVRRAVRAHFDRELSFDAVGAKLAAMYRDTIARRQRATGGEAARQRRAWQSARSPSES
jgi:glycosyltransferase involved in cell wall biosynthesis